MSLKARLAVAGKRALKADVIGSGADFPPPRPLSPALAGQLAQALVAHILAADSASDGDALLLAAKVISINFIPMQLMLS